MMGSAPDAVTLEEMASMIHDGGSVVSGGMPLWRKPLTLIRAIIEAGVRNLDYSSFLASLDAEFLIRAGCVRELEYGYVGHDLLGSSVALRRDTSFHRRTRTEVEYWAAIRASADGSDSYPDAFDNPVPAARYDTCILHAAVADGAGNIYGLPLDAMEEDDALLAASSSQVLITVERREDAPPVDAELLLPSHAVSAIAVSPGGSRPLGMAGFYSPSIAQILELSEPG